ncbi:MAG TPA: protein kinase [Polyangiaceae bacterium]|nr:protein kinase [Polyangiaceae bacterium]
MYPQVFGKYVLERELARGGMARVVLATLRGAGGFEKRLVVKQIRDELACDEEFVRRFVEEAKTAVALAHPNIVPVYELGVELGTYFLAMEFVEGASLAELLRASPRGLTPEEGAYVGVEVCRALDYAHRRMNVVHRDVTPRNVMVDEEGQIKVIDFGIAAPVATAPGGHGIFGSPGHMPPEQIQGRELTAAADVFAVAVLLMELWGGKAPFRRRTNEEVDAAMQAPHPKPSDVDPRLIPLDETLANAMSLDAASRPQQADDLGRALRRFLSGVDLGDVARQLGARVREARARPPAANEARFVLQRPPSRPTAAQVGTKTFAARPELNLRASAEPSTRKLASTPAPAMRDAERTVETLATSPIETGPRATPAERPSPRIWIRLTLGGCFVAVAAFLLGRGIPAGTSSGTTTIAAPPAALTNSMPTIAIPASNAPTPTTATAVPDPPVAATRTVPPERAQVVLLGDGTVVRVDGVSRGACPTRIAIEPGSHTIAFSFPATGESKSERVNLRAGDRITLRADFTAAVPTIRLER